MTFKVISSPKTFKSSWLRFQYRNVCVCVYIYTVLVLSFCHSTKIGLTTQLIWCVCKLELRLVLAKRYRPFFSAQSGTQTLLDTPGPCCLLVCISLVVCKRRVYDSQSGREIKYRLKSPFWSCSCLNPGGCI